MKLKSQSSTVTLSNDGDTTRRHTLQATVRITKEGSLEAIEGGSVVSVTDFQQLAYFGCGRDGSGLNINTMGQSLDTQQYMAIFADVLDFVDSAKEYVNGPRYVIDGKSIEDLAAEALNAE